MTRKVSPRPYDAYNLRRLRERARPIYPLVDALIALGAAFIGAVLALAVLVVAWMVTFG